MVYTVQILFRSQFNAFFFFFFLFVLTAACLYNSRLHLFTVRVFWQSCCLQTRWMTLSSVSGYMMSGLFLAVCKMSNSASFCLCCHTPGQRGDGGDAGWLMSSPLLPLSCIQVCRCFHLCVRWNKYKLNYMNIPIFSREIFIGIDFICVAASCFTSTQTNSKIKKQWLRWWVKKWPDDLDLSSTGRAKTSFCGHKQKNKTNSLV